MHLDCFVIARRIQCKTLEKSIHRNKEEQKQSKRKKEREKGVYILNTHQVKSRKTENGRSFSECQVMLMIVQDGEKQNNNPFSFAANLPPSMLFFLFVSALQPIAFIFFLCVTHVVFVNMAQMLLDSSFWWKKKSSEAIYNINQAN